jgi:hypothetical protein
MAKYRHRGSVDVYQREPESNWWVWVIGGIVILAFLSQCSG